MRFNTPKAFCHVCSGYVESPCYDPDCPVPDEADAIESGYAPLPDDVEEVRFDDLEESDYFGDPADDFEFTDMSLEEDVDDYRFSCDDVDERG